MPRNEFKGWPTHESDCPAFGSGDLPVEGCTCTPIPMVSVDHPGKGEDEDLNPEAVPSEEAPSAVTLADLRKEPGFSTTQAHRKLPPS